ncbi:hypothetical protein G6F56_008915 [Rhizopus delemar]|nr:hypothetical protein G6F56_008915 [Rhizopus delemar]
MSEIPNSKRLPRNAAAPIPFTSPAQAFFDQYIPTASPSAYSEIDVILDDGTLQRRTVSLSTLPEDDLLPEDDEPPYEPPYQPPYEPEHDESGPKKKTYGDEDSDDSSDNFTRKWTFDGLTAQQKLVLKCSFAYILGCLFTFVPTLNALIGNNRVSSHLVATATVFFNPAKSLGGMVEAALYGWGYTLFAVTICLGSMLTTDFFIDRQETLMAHTFSLVWLAAATFVIAFLKAHWNKPPVATASSLCFIIIFIIVVREGSANKGDFDTTRIEQITFAVATGTLITVSCCILFWPISASKKLRKEFEATLTSYKVLLKLLTKTFLLDDDLPEFTANQSLQTAIESHRTTFTSLEKSLKEAKLEVWNTEIHSCITEYEEVVKSMQRLAQSMGGIKSSCGLQFEWIKKNYKVKSDRQIKKHKDLTDFVHSIRQPLKSLAFTCKQTLLHLQVEFSDLPRTGPSDDTLIDNLQKAMVLFDVSQKKAMERLNRKRYVPTDDVFLVYFFVFNMLEFARDLSSLVESVRSLSLAKEKKQGGFGLFLGYFTAPKNKMEKDRFTFMGHIFFIQVTKDSICSEGYDCCSIVSLFGLFTFYWPLVS